MRSLNEDSISSVSTGKTVLSFADPRTNLGRSTKTASTAGLIINADDWGRDRENTNRSFDCVRQGTVSAVSAMVFMEDSERAAGIAREAGIDAGLHLNFSAPFTGRNCPVILADRHRELATHLLRHPLARVFYHPGLKRAFEYVIAAQLDEYRRLFGFVPERIDGHHHLHLCTNVVADDLLPAGTLVRRNFWFRPGEKSLLNRIYRKAVDRRLARRHRLVDFLVNLHPLEPYERLRGIFALAERNVVELEAHPVKQEEYSFLTGEFVGQTAELPIVSFQGLDRSALGGAWAQDRKLVAKEFDHD